MPSINITGPGDKIDTMKRRSEDPQLMAFHHYETPLQIPEYFLRAEGKSNGYAHSKDKPDGGDENSTEFEEAVALTGHGKFHHLLMLGCGLCLVSMITETLSTSYLLPAAQCDFNMSANEKGLLNAVVYVGMICSSHMWGYLADTRGRRKILVLTVFLNSLCTLIAGFMPNFWLYLTLRFFNGIFICGPSAVVYAFLGEFHSDKTRTRATVWVCVFIALGIGMQPGIAWLIIPQNWSLELPGYTFHSWRVFVIACGVPSIITAILLFFFLPESPKFLLASGKEQEALDVLRHIYTTNTGKDSSLYPVKALKLDVATIHAAESSSVFAVIRHMWNQTVPIFKPPYVLSTIVACFIQFGLYSSSNGFLLWTPDLFNRLGQYQTQFPNNSVTVCEAVNALLGLDLVNPLRNSTMTMITLQHLDGSNSSTERYLLEDILDNNSTQMAESCNSDVDPLAFQNTLIIGLASAVACILVGYLINFIPKKTILLAFLVASGGSGLGIYFVTSYAEILVLALFYVALSGMCVSVVNSVVIDEFPTHLRAMALCISLMMGRVGTVSSNVMLGFLLELNCSLVIFILSGIVIVCGLLSFLLPSQKKKISH